MQEELCSSRILVFVNDQVYFRCQQSTFNENMQIEGRPGNHEQSYTLMSDIFRNPIDFSNFEDLILYYARRDMTYLTDYLRACQGMLRKLSQAMKLAFFEGLPVQFERSLIFSNYDRKFSSRREGYPSYSWTGWYYVPSWAWMSAEIDIPQSLREKKTDRYTFNYEWIIWYILSHDGWREVPTEFQNKLKPAATPATSTVLDESIRPPFGLLFVWSISIYLKIAKSSSTLDNCYDAFNARNTICGTVLLDANDILEASVQQFALVSRYEDRLEHARDIFKGPVGEVVETGYFSMLMKSRGKVMERRGLLKTSNLVIADSLPPGPEWRSFILS